MAKDLMRYIDENRKNINEHYDMKYGEILEIYGSSKGEFEAMLNAFTYGYMQGRKATLAEIKKELNKNPALCNVMRTACEIGDTKIIRHATQYLKERVQK